MFQLAAVWLGMGGERRAERGSGSAILLCVYRKLRGILLVYCLCDDKLTTTGKEHSNNLR